MQKDVIVGAVYFVTMVNKKKSTVPEFKDPKTAILEVIQTQNAALLQLVKKLSTPQQSAGTSSTAHNRILTEKFARFDVVSFNDPLRFWVIW